MYLRGYHKFSKEDAAVLASSTGSSMETASSSSLTYRMSIMGVVGGCGQLVYWMGGAKRIDWVVELGEGIGMCQVWFC